MSIEDGALIVAYDRAAVFRIESLGQRRRSDGSRNITMSWQRAPTDGTLLGEEALSLSSIPSLPTSFSAGRAALRGESSSYSYSTPGGKGPA